MKDLLLLLAHLLSIIAKLLGHGRAKTVVAENLIMKQHLLILSRSRRRAPSLSALERYLFGLWSSFLSAHHIRVQRNHVFPPIANESNEGDPK